MAEVAFIARTPFTDVPAESANAPGVTAVHRDGVRLAAVIARRGRCAALAQRVRERCGIELPHGSYRSEAHGIAFAGTGPQAWLAESESEDKGFVVSLREELGPLASVSEQSDAYAVLRLSGPKVRDTLAKLIPIDLHARAFKPGDVAATVAAHIGVLLWRLDDAPDGMPQFDIAVFRSLAASFWHALSQAAAQFGLQMRPVA